MSDIHLLTSAEVPLLEPLISAFFAEGDIAGKFDPKFAAERLKGHIDAGTGFCLVAGAPFRGGICGMMSNDMATGEPCAMEWFWYVHAAERGSLGIRLLDAFEQECKARNAVRIYMMHHVNEKTEKFKRIYESRGYVLREQVFVRSIT